MYRLKKKNNFVSNFEVFIWIRSRDKSLNCVSEAPKPKQIGCKSKTDIVRHTLHTHTHQHPQISSHLIPLKNGSLYFRTRNPNAERRTMCVSFLSFQLSQTVASATLSHRANSQLSVFGEKPRSACAEFRRTGPGRMIRSPTPIAGAGRQLRTDDQPWNFDGRERGLSRVLARMLGKALKRVSSHFFLNLPMEETHVGVLDGVCLCFPDGCFVFTESC